jgi:hypothetical protein
MHACNVSFLKMYMNKTTSTHNLKGAISTSGDRQTQVIKDGTLCFKCNEEDYLSLGTKNDACNTSFHGGIYKNKKHTNTHRKAT